MTGKNKYGAKKTPWNGVVYDSKAEARFAAYLQLLQNSLDNKVRVKNVERQVVFQLLPGITYRADFVVTYSTGKRIVYDVKGFVTKEFRMKAKMMRHFHPGLPLVIVRMNKRGFSTEEIQ